MTAVTAEKSPNHGVVFVATGTRYIRCAIIAARSVQATNPNLPIALFTDDKALAAETPGLFAHVLDIGEVHHRSKIDCMARSPFSRTLFLDADTRVLNDITEMFQLLERYDLAMAHAHARNREATRATWLTPLPDSFPQFNTGVLLYRMNPQMQALFDDWQVAYRKAGFRKDQVTLRELLWHSDLCVATLPPEYNIRYPKYLWLWGRREARPRICHFRRFGFDRRRDWLRDLTGRVRRQFVGWVIKVRQ
jgi:hypothetical protein